MQVSEWTRPLRLVAMLTVFMLSAVVVACGDSEEGTSAGGGATTAKEAGWHDPDGDEVREGHGPEGDRRADQVRCHRHEGPWHRLDGHGAQTRLPRTSSA